MARKNDKHRAQREKFRKRIKCLQKKADELSQTAADIYLVIHREHRYYVYQSTEREGWPPSQEELVSFIAASSDFEINRYKRANYPPTIIRKPTGFEIPKEKDEDQESEDADQHLNDACKEGRRVIIMPKTPLL